MLAALCSGGRVSGAESLTLQSTQSTSTGFFYVAVKGFAATAYTLTLEWRGSSGACSVGMPFGGLIHRVDSSMVSIHQSSMLCIFLFDCLCFAACYSLLFRAVQVNLWCVHGVPIWRPVVCIGKHCPFVPEWLFIVADEWAMCVI